MGAFEVWGLGFRVLGLGFRALGLGSGAGARGLWPRVQDLGLLRCRGFRFRRMEGFADSGSG